jgi:hypothetical protein
VSPVRAWSRAAQRGFAFKVRGSRYRKAHERFVADFPFDLDPVGLLLPLCRGAVPAAAEQSAAAVDGLRLRGRLGRAAAPYLAHHSTRTGVQTCSPKRASIRIVSGVIVEVSANKISVPFQCPCCGNDGPDGEFVASYTRSTGKRVVHHTTRGLSFPYCTPCLAHVQIWESADAITMGVIITGIIVAIIVGVSAGGTAGFVVFGISIPVALVLAARRRNQARARCGPGCAVPGVAVSYLGWSGSVKTFSFGAAVYAGRFAQRNARNLVNVSADLRRVLEHPALATPAVEEPPLVPAQRTVAAPSSAAPVLDWIARIESYKGPVARRNALERALQETQDLHGRQQLVIAASRIEVAAVLDKVDSLASSAAQKRHLEKAIADVRADNIPDELQAAELQQLEERLRSLG